MTTGLRICLAQINFKVADISGNLKKILTAIKEAQTQADLIIFPELTLTSYPPEDLLLRQDFYHYIEQALATVCQNTNQIDVLIGYPKQINNTVYNTIAWIQQGKIIAEYFKQKLPNYGVFDEKRYFQTGNSPTIVDFKGYKIGLAICEDLWFSEPIRLAKNVGAELIISPNASPFSVGKKEKRLAVLKKRINETKLPIIYVNHIGGQDDLLFDGSSFVLNSEAEVCLQAPAFKEGLFYTEITKLNQCLHINKQALPKQSKLAIIYEGLVTGVRDYINKNGFPGAIIGLSGGIDSALTLCIAVDALGKDRVQTIMMPSPYTADISQIDAKEQAKTLDVNYQVIEIQPVFSAFLQQLAPLFRNLPADKTEENIQARIRGTLLMAVSNKIGRLVLTTSNKSETAVGYTTLYGDMAGGFCVLKDVYKTLVYQLADYRNSLSPAIPRRVIERSPSAELAPNQKDQDSLPPYEILDEIIACFIEHDLSLQEIIDKGFSPDTVKKVLRMIHINEYKRRQSPPGPKITGKAFSRNRRYPITSGFDSLIL
ncbi:MAG: NAD+ synthase [Gammaproteobacteria bacterium RIFCSPHIGHO2_12_FULL_35_23]|nr:MAG: NAD+ synthase [Gammaproteobacteria bacterium RIFCSPHIGHO2_12_FULL_35_23]